jgi:cardiolipin synthase
VDGKVGFTGGVGMGTEWREGLNGLPPWRETHFKAEGPVVAQMQAVFVDNWIKATGRVLHGAEYFPKLPATAGDMDAQMFGSSPVGGSESMHLMVLLALTAAKTSIDIGNAYFVPDKLTVEALCSAASRGVRVRIVLPGRHTDARIGRWAAQGLYGALLKSGIQIYEYQPTMMHSKVLVIDGLWTSVGSANFDDRSFRLNDEANLNVFSDDLAREQIRLIDADILQSRRMVLNKWRHRKFGRRINERLALLLRSQL